MLGLIPSSEMSWATGVRVLKPTGGMMHVHGNVGGVADDFQAWGAHVAASMTALAGAAGLGWVATCTHVEVVKSYAPRVYHLVADIQCCLPEV
jgi:tRNA wybutosine-synthesizing protein 3